MMLSPVRDGRKLFGYSGTVNRVPDCALDAARLWMGDARLSGTVDKRIEPSC
jgi:hypothetical protein